MAGMGPRDMEMALVHDSFTITAAVPEEEGGGSAGEGCD